MYIFKAISRIFENHLIYSHLRGVFTLFHFAIRRIIRNSFKDNQSKIVLDLCCGPGDFATNFMEIHYLALDISLNYISALQLKNFENVSVILGDAIKSPLKKQSVDMCLLINCAHHFDDNSFDLLLEEIIRILKPGGRILFIDPITDRGGILQKFILSLDRGDYCRSSTEIFNKLNKNFVFENNFFFRNGMWMEWYYLGRRR
ncbi:class I SAM-dependent methyltransferase [bacterium]|nr:class I SAM-dependent methyltransferase [bacterium]